MHSRERADVESTSSNLAQTLGGVSLLVTVLLLFIIALLSIGGVAVKLHLGANAPQTPPVAAKPPPEAVPQVPEREVLYGKLGGLGQKLSEETAIRNRLASRLERLLELRRELIAQSEGPAGAKVESAVGDAHAALLRSMEEIERELGSVSQALEASEKRISADQIEISGLGARLNRALLVKVEELQRGRSEFFARLRDVLGDRPDFRIEGDRFTLPSEVLFAPGSDRLRPQGVEEVNRLAARINAVKSEFPPGLGWVLRVSGHTDPRPIANSRFPSNWELSALRAITVVKTLIAAGVPPEHVAAAGFGEFQPIAIGDDDATLARNRRIEFRLDQP